MQAPAQARKYSPTTHVNWGRYTRFFVMGPLTGALVGYAQVTIAYVIWVSRGCPDFYFRGMSGVVLTYLIYIAGGGMVGIAYGGLLELYEGYTHRRIRLIIALGLVVLLSSIITVPVVDSEFNQLNLIHPAWLFAPQAIAPVLALLASCLSSDPGVIQDP